MTVLKVDYEQTKNTVDFLNSLIESENYLFHITNETNSNAILHSGKVLPLTIDGLRHSTLYREGKIEKGTSSFTTNPIQIYREDIGDCFTDKSIVLVFERRTLSSRGVKPAIYVPIEELIEKHLYDYRYADEEASFENEWRSNKEVDIRGALRYICKVPERKYNVATNNMYFSGEIK